jgi:hypothetical protein
MLTFVSMTLFYEEWRPEAAIPLHYRCHPDVCQDLPLNNCLYLEQLRHIHRVSLFFIAFNSKD